MALSDISDPAAVRAAMAEFDKLGEDAFLRMYKYAPHYQFAVRVGNKQYDAKALLGVAHGYQFPTIGPLSTNSFPEGAQTVQILQALGYKVINRSAIITKSGRIFGDIPGYPPGSRFPNRIALAAAQVHKPTRAGISRSKADGADSIVISGGYRDDEDHGDWLIYTGHGGQGDAGKQVADQELIDGNLGLARSQLESLPVRVIRGANGDPRYSPREGYRYDGLFLVEQYWHEIGLEGFRVYRYKLIRSSDYMPPPETSTTTILLPAPRNSYIVQRIIRDSALSRQVKELYSHRCQICGTKIATQVGFYAEGAHIRPLGRPHDGIDRLENILCLCPNDHVRFDKGAIYITEDLSLKESMTAKTLGHLAAEPSHNIDQASIDYHRERIANIPTHK